LQPHKLLHVCVRLQLSTLLRPLHLLATKLVWSKVREALGIRCACVVCRASWTYVPFCTQLPTLARCVHEQASAAMA